MATMGNWDQIHASAVIDESAEINPGATIGPFCVIGAKVQIGAGSVLHPSVHIVKNTRIGRNCQIHSGAVIGGPPQDHKFKDEMSFVIIGDGNILREYVTIHRATGENNATTLGDHNMLMAYAHIGHNCDIGNHVTIAGYVGISGHVTIEDSVNFGGLCGVHQFCRIGTLAMIGGMSGVAQDAPPYMLVAGRPARVYDVNVRGLRRAGVPAKVRGELKRACKLLYRSDLNQSQALEAIEEEIEKSAELEHLLAFIRHTRDGQNGRGNSSTPPM